MIVAAAASGSGKTTITLALLRHYRNAGVAVSSAKVGPDYIDPAFHAKASGRPCYNLDTWAMRPGTLARLVEAVGEGARLVIVEGVMGLFDGGPGGVGSTADLAARTGWPVVLVVDARGMAATAAAIVQGIAGHRADVAVSGVIFNRVGSAAHTALLAEACAPLGIPVLGALRPSPTLELPDRHLGLVQAAEHPDLEGFLEGAARRIADDLDTTALQRLARPPGRLDLAANGGSALPPLGQRIAVAVDAAFSFTYAAALRDWRHAGAEILPFSPLADQAPDPSADAIVLPGGYPELHVGRLAANEAALEGLRRAAGRGAVVYGECGGYMVLGRVLIDADGRAHALAGLLPVETSFARRRMTLGYRALRLVADGPLGASGAAFRGHEFHFASIVAEDGGNSLFQSRDARNRDLGGTGCRVGTVMGSFAHLIDRAE